MVTLTKKDRPFLWTNECTTALNTLIDTVLSNPSLRQPDLSRPFFLQVDASAFATGAILTQTDDRDKHVIVGLHSQTFNDAERNYDIHDRELLAVYRGLTAHRHLLLSSPFPVTLYTDHKNLEYYRHPHHINRRIARYLPRLADYNFVLTHIPGHTNKADPLSRRPDYDIGSDDNTDVTVLPAHLFARACVTHGMFRLLLTVVMALVSSNTSRTSLTDLRSRLRVNLEPVLLFSYRHVIMTSSD